MIADIWQWTPLMFLIFLSGLVALPEDQMNAARILGAGFVPQFTRLIIPMMRPILLIAVIIRAMEIFKLFDPIIIMTQGGPGTATQNLSVYFYRLTNVSGRWGYACAVALLVLIALSILAKQAIKPIERAQNESLEELMGAGTDVAERAHRGRDRRRSTRMKKALRISAVSAFALFFGFPLYWVITMAFKPKVEENPPGIVVWHPENPTLKNFKDVLGINNAADSIFASKDFSALTPLKNSFLAAGGGTLLALLVGVFAAYGIARFRAGGSQLPFQILQLRMFPPAAVVIPLYFMFVYLHLWNTLEGLIIIYGAVTFPFVVWLMRSFFQDVPREISEAAIVDGCTPVGRVLQGRAAAGQGRPRGDGAVRLHPQLVRLPDRARDDAGQVDDRAALPEHDERRRGRAGVRPPGGARRPADPAAGDPRALDPEVPRPRPHLRRDQAVDDVLDHAENALQALR